MLKLASLLRVPETWHDIYITPHLIWNKREDKKLREELCRHTSAGKSNIDIQRGPKISRAGRDEGQHRYTMEQHGEVFASLLNKPRHLDFMDR